MYRSSLLLPVCVLRAYACKNSVSQIISLVFSTAKMVFPVYIGRENKQRGFCTRSGGVLLAVRTGCLQLGSEGGEREMLNHMVLPVWQVSVV